MQYQTNLYSKFIAPSKEEQDAACSQANNLIKHAVRYEAAGNYGAGRVKRELAINLLRKAGVMKDYRCNNG
jgi:hypothetical protein